MTTFDNALDYVMDQISQGVIFEHGPNVEIIRMMGIRAIEGKLMAQVRKELNTAVKNGYLGRLPKTQFGPEFYHHPNARPAAIEAQRKIEAKNIEAIKKVFI